MAAEQRDDLLAFARAHQAGIDEDAGELVADRFMDQHRGDGGIHAARQAADHLALADLFADFLHHGGAEGVHVPFRLDAGDVQHEVLVDLRAARRVHHFGMELDAVELALLVGDHGIGRMVRGRHDGKARRDGGDLVAMVHPHRLAVADGAQPGQQRRLFGDHDVGAAEFAGVAAFDLAAQLVRHRHLAIADAQHRHARFEHRLRRARRALFHDRWPGRRTG